MKLEQAAREVIRQHSMECLSDKTVDALREALAEPVTEPAGRCKWCLAYNGHLDFCPALAEQAEGVIVKTCPDGYGTITTEQAEQEPEVWYCPDCGTLSETQVKCCPDWIRSRKVTKNFAITCKATFDRNGQAEQEPVLWGDDKFAPHERPQKPEECANGCPPLQVCDYCQTAEQAEQEPVAFIGQGLKPIVPEDLEKLRKHEPGTATLYDTSLYAAPVRTKDLTDDEIVELIEKHWDLQRSLPDFARAAIAADREKNK